MVWIALLVIVKESSTFVLPRLVQNGVFPDHTSLEINDTVLQLFAERSYQAPSFRNYNPDSYFEFYQFENAVSTNGARVGPGYKYRFSNAIIHVVSMLDTAYQTLLIEGKKSVPDDSSYLRYFEANSGLASSMSLVILRMMQAVGAPPWDDPQIRQQCMYAFPKIRIFYEDPPAYMVDSTKSSCSGTNGPNAFVFVAKNDPAFRDGIVICDRWFSNYRALEMVQPQFLGPYIEFGYDFRADEPSYISAFTLLHGKSNHMIGIYSLLIID